MGDMWDDMEPDDSDDEETPTEATERQNELPSTQAPKADTASQATEPPKADNSEDTDPYTTPAFKYDSDIQRALYVPENSWTPIERLFSKGKAQTELDDVLDVRKSEVHNAFAKLAKERISPEELSAEIKRERGLDPNNLED